MSKNPLTCLQWLQDSIHKPTLRQASSESVVFMLLAVETVAVEEVDVSMAYVAAEDAEEEVDELEEDRSEEVMEEAAVNTKTELVSHMSPITLKIQSGPHSQTIK